MPLNRDEAGAVAERVGMLIPLSGECFFGGRPCLHRSRAQVYYLHQMHAEEIAGPDAPAGRSTFIVCADCLRDLLTVS
jgi:hypothetical protein